MIRDPAKGASECSKGNLDLETVMMRKPKCWHVGDICLDLAFHALKLLLPRSRARLFIFIYFFFNSLCSTGVSLKTNKDFIYY